MLVELVADLLFFLVVDDCDGALEGCEDWAVVGEFQGCCVIVHLTEVVAFGQDTIAPCGNAGLVAAIILVCADIVLVRGQKCDPRFVVVGECLAMDHLKVELCQN